ncbi:hypothetical protein DPMN_154396 [Dreissena polymorpha]|uniref:DUF3504 domain-containing protein n=1 Tax=Dreissena polymorpha TaxID=45954 RepID=A0A9D4FKC7_DREPO|nr:hypothetical protein DPMN_154396 [Dreissena polymorpha]
MPKAFERPDDPCCPVKVYKAYRDHRPSKLMCRFYLQDIKSPSSDVWYSETAVEKVR